MKEWLEKVLTHLKLKKAEPQQPVTGQAGDAASESKPERKVKEHEDQSATPQSWQIDWKQPKYLFPLVVLVPFLFFGYEIINTFGGSSERTKGVVTDSINMLLPGAVNEEMGDKMSEMNKRFSEEDAATAVGGLGEDEQQGDTLGNGYQENELDEIDRQNALNRQKQKEVEDLQRRMAESRRHINSYNEGAFSGSHPSRQSEIDDYAKEIEAIQRRSMARQKALEQTTGNEEPAVTESAGLQKGRPSKPKEEKPEVVRKVMDDNAGKFNTVSAAVEAETSLIRAMIDKTTKAHEGTRLRFKLLDDVTLKGTTLKKGTYLYGTVTGFSQQRVMATITSILIRDRFIRVGLSVYDNDGMEGFYVPESAFRDLVRDARANALQSNINFDGGYGSELSGEALALQALQNMYQSATSAVSANIRKNKARIKYNTIVYLVNTGAE